MNSLRRHSLLLLPALACSLALAAPASAGQELHLEHWLPSLTPLPAARTPTRAPGDVSEAALGKSAVCLINKQRARRGLRKLRLNSRLSKAAQRHTARHGEAQLLRSRLQVGPATSSTA